MAKIKFLSINAEKGIARVRVSGTALKVSGIIPTKVGFVAYEGDAEEGSEIDETGLAYSSVSTSESTSADGAVFTWLVF